MVDDTLGPCHHRQADFRVGVVGADAGDAQGLDNHACYFRRRLHQTRSPVQRSWFLSPSSAEVETTSDILFWKKRVHIFAMEKKYENLHHDLIYLVAPMKLGTDYSFKRYLFTFF